MLRANGKRVNSKGGFPVTFVEFQGGDELGQYHLHDGAHYT